MKPYFHPIYLLVLGVLVLFSCEKDEERAVFKPAGDPALSASESSLLFTEETAAAEIATFSWTFPGFGYQAATEYTLEFDLSGNDFAAPRSVVAGSALIHPFKGETLNNVLLQLGLAPEEEATIEVRLKASAMGVSGVVEKATPLYSNTISLVVTPYSTFVEPAYVYVPGAYQGWDPGTAAALISIEDDGIYEGYVSFPDAESLEFKIAPEKSWDLSYGEGGGGTLVSENGPNLKVAKPGTYLIKADLNELTWEAVPYSWGIIGDATAGGWDADQEMRFDHTEGVWKITTDLTPGVFKFRLNKDWGVNYGDDNPEDEMLNAGGADIPVGTAGSYEIMLDLREAENPVYSVTQK